jgi:hypothetical protein
MTQADSLKPSQTEPGSPLQGVQGEGDCEAGRRHRESAESFVESGRVERAARGAAPTTPEQAQSLLDAEQAGERHSKGEDPASKHPPPRTPASAS